MAVALSMDRGALRAHAPVALVVACLVLLPLGRLVEIAVLTMAAWGAWLLLSERQRLLGLPGARLLGLVFLVATVPMWLSLIDAYDRGDTFRVTLSHLRFYLAGLFMVWYLRDPDAQAWLLRGCSWVLVFWIVDGAVQFVFGTDLFGFEAWPGRISAMFGEGNSKFGLTLAALFPLLWEHARRRWPGWAQGAVLAGVLGIVFLGGSRAAWITMAAAIATYVVLLWLRRRRFPLVPVLASILALTVVAGAAWRFTDHVPRYVDSTVDALTGQADPMTNSIAHRYVIWRAAWNMFVAHPVNGVGVRGFRHAYPEYTAEDDPFMKLDPPTIALHSHQLFTEVGTETGVIGLVGLLLTVWFLARAGWRAPPEVQRHMLPFAVALAAAYFPLNTHLALYSSYWSQIVWWLIGLYCAAYGVVATGDSVSSADSSAAQIRAEEK